MIYGWLGDVALVLARLFVGSLLIIAGVLKLKAGPRWFLQQILAYEIVKGKSAWLLSHCLPAVELICGLLLLIGWQTAAVALVSFGLLWGFSAAIVSTTWRGKQVGCGCFGQRNSTVSQRGQWTIVYRNLGLMGLLIPVYGFAPIWSVDAWLTHRLPSIGATAWVQTGLAALWLLPLLATLTWQRLAQRQVAGKRLVKPAASAQR